MLTLRSYFNPRAPRGARQALVFAASMLRVISIHVPREGHDILFSLLPPIVSRISIHVPREGHDYKQTALFLLDIDFNPRAPRGARHFDYSIISNAVVISIHVPREGHDAELNAEIRATAVNFNPRAPRGARLRPSAKPKHVTRHFNPRAPRGARLKSAAIRGHS